MRSVSAALGPVKEFAFIHSVGLGAAYEIESVYVVDESVAVIILTVSADFPFIYPQGISEVFVKAVYSTVKYRYDHFRVSSSQSPCVTHSHIGTFNCILCN